ncbi:MAG: GAF domain-containing sensor histidine kinase [Chloroflexi bacterium]|nr:GAF domain-containing sensor histidine kinase [Chloroflexota bacterium]
MRALVALGTALAATLDLDELLDKALTLALEFSGHDQGSLMLLAPERKSLTVQAAVGGDLSRLHSVIPVAGGSVASWVLRRKRPLYLEGRAESLTHVPRAYSKDLPSSISLPLLKPPRQAIGVVSLNATRQAAHLSPDDIEVLQIMANQLAIALDNADLYRRLQIKEQQLQEAATRLVHAQEEERRRVAYDIHDGLAQMLVGTYQRLQAFQGRRPGRAREAKEELSGLQDQFRRSLEEVRRVIADLRPSSLDDFGLERSLQQYLAEAGREAGWSVQFTFATGGLVLLPHCEATIFRILQEAVSNARKHAHSPRLLVKVARRAHHLVIEVRDWGNGFDVDTSRHAAGPGQRVGLMGMAERATVMGGAFQIKSQPGKGTQVMVRFPLEAIAGLERKNP